MNYLQSYKLFENSFVSKDKEYLLDIFRELEDIGFYIDVEEYDTEIRVRIRKHYKLNQNRHNEIQKFKYTDVSDAIESAADYMKSAGYDRGDFTWYGGYGAVKKFTPEEINYLTSNKRLKSLNSIPSKIVNFNKMSWVDLKFIQKNDRISV